MNPLHSRALGCALSLSLLSACNSGGPPPVPPAVPAPPAAVAPVGGNVVPTNAGNLVGNDGASLVPGVLGAASVDGAPFAGADLKVFRLGDPSPIGTGKTDDQGRFFLELGPAAKPGLALKVVASKGGQTLASVGASSMVAAGGGNMVAAGGGNMVAAGGGNMVAAGGGNMVAAGGLNYAVAQAGDPASAVGFVRLSLASTLAVVLLAPRLEAAGDASTGGGGVAIQAAVAELLAAFDQMVTAATAAITANPALAASITSGMDARTGAPSLDAAARLIADSGLVAAFQASAERLGNAIVAGIDAGGQRPDAQNLREISIGGITIPAIRLPAVIPSERDEPGTGGTTATTGGTTTGGSTGGSSGGGSSGSDGSDDDEVEPGTVALQGNLEQPTYQPSSSPNP